MCATIIGCVLLLLLVCSDEERACVSHLQLLFVRWLPLALLSNFFPQKTIFILFSQINVNFQLLN